MRRGPILAVLAVFALGVAAGGAAAQIATGAHADHPVLSATYAEPTAVYDHAILGDALEWSALDLTIGPCSACDPATPPLSLRMTLPAGRVFEDIAPRIVDADGDGRAEVLVVETDLALGARLALYDNVATPLAATPFIGQTHRWLAPVGQGVGDLDGDGRPEIAYVDRPHLDRVLRVWRLEGGALVEVAALAGVTNHRIGEDVITGGIRSCGTGDEAIVVSADWTRIVAVRLEGGTLVPRDIGAFDGSRSVDAAMACRS